MPQPLSLTILPHEILLRIFDTLDSKTTSACLGLTCRAFYKMHIHLNGFVGLLTYTSSSIPNPQLAKWVGTAKEEEYGGKWLTPKQRMRMNRLSSLPESISKNIYLWELLETWMQGREDGDGDGVQKGANDRQARGKLVFYKRGMVRFISVERREELEREYVQRWHARVQAKYGN
ncbi:hypothetical protein BGZ60DRAFT_423766 [Tricladium varicosporioides]|nr:hypothetical protein BGZ60DRAFT_423766 [Hymenoscyphus varicosporioides]